MMGAGSCIQRFKHTLNRVHVVSPATMSSSVDFPLPVSPTADRLIMSVGAPARRPPKDRAPGPPSHLHPRVPDNRMLS